MFERFWYIFGRWFANSCKIVWIRNSGYIFREEVVRGVLRNFAKFTGKHLCQSLFLIKLQVSNTGAGTGVLLVNFVKFPRTPFFIKNLWWLLLYLELETRLVTLACEDPFLWNTILSDSIVIFLFFFVEVYTIAVIISSNFFCLFDLHSRD